MNEQINEVHNYNVHNKFPLQTMHVHSTSWTQIPHKLKLQKHLYNNTANKKLPLKTKKENIGRHTDLVIIF